MATPLANRGTLVRQAILLEILIIAYNLAEGVISIVAGVIAGSVVLVGFGMGLVAIGGLALLCLTTFNKRHLLAVKRNAGIFH